MPVHRPSTVDQLPAELREAIAELRQAGRTIDEIRDHLIRLLPGDRVPSRSAIGRHVKGLAEVGERLRRSREVAEALVRKLGDAPEDRTARLNVELLHTAVLDLFMADGGEEGEPGVPMDPESIHFLARALKDLSSAKKADAELILKLRTEATKAAAAAATKVATERGLSADTVDAIKASILGVAQ